MVETIAKMVLRTHARNTQISRALANALEVSERAGMMFVLRTATERVGTEGGAWEEHAPCGAADAEGDDEDRSQILKRVQLLHRLFVVERGKDDGQLPDGLLPKAAQPRILGIIGGGGGVGSGGGVDSRNARRRSRTRVRVRDVCRRCGVCHARRRVGGKARWDLWAMREDLAAKLEGMSM